MIDPLISLSFAIQSSPGVYAILLGSGLSKSASIPTGWEIVLDLTQKMALAMGEDAGDDPAEWYKAKFGKAADYADLLDALCKTPAERQQLLRTYFEPNDEERRQGLKQPTKAHGAIAKLVRQGFIRVVITTNFDHLMERAIQDEGLAPTVISTADAISGAMPIVHQKCCVIKVHGDYLDSRLKNTPAELSKFDKRMNRLLDEVFDAFGLIVCGWSAEWDTGLRSVLERARSRRFSMYWTTRSNPGGHAAKLITHRKAVPIRIGDADSFFTKLQDLVDGIEQSNRSHPTSVSAVAALAKRFLADPTHEIAIADLLHDETEQARDQIDPSKFDLSQALFDETDRVYSQLRAAIERLQAVLIEGGAWGRESIDHFWIAALERIQIQIRLNTSNYGEWFRLYPTMVLLYAFGLAAIAQGNLRLLRQILYRTQYHEPLNEPKPLILNRFWREINDWAKSLPGLDKLVCPRSQHMFNVMRQPLGRYLPGDSRYEWSFDFLEYLIGFAHIELELKLRHDRAGWCPPGRFCWKARNDDYNVVQRAELQLKTEREKWNVLKAGFANGNPALALEIQSKMRSFISSLPWH